MGLRGHLRRVLQHANAISIRQGIFIGTIIVGAVIVLAVIIAGKQHTTPNAQGTSSNPVVISYSKKLPLLKQAAKKNAKSSGAHSSYAEALYIVGDKKTAAAEYEAALTIDPKNATNQNNLGNIYRDLANYPKANTAYHAAIDLAPSDQKAYLNLANMQLYSEKKPTDAIATYQLALRKLGNSPQLELLLGLAYEQNGQKAEARSSYQRILQSDPTNQAAQNNLERLGN